MSGLNFLLWTFAVILILGVVISVAVGVYAIRVRNRAIKEISKRSGFMSRLKEAQALRHRGSVLRQVALLQQGHTDYCGGYCLHSRLRLRENEKV